MRSPPARRPSRISYGNTIKKEADVARAHALGVRLYAVDCAAEVEKVARAAPGAKVFCRIFWTARAAEWPLSRKFGWRRRWPASVLERAHALGLVAHGLSFHVGSQQRNPRMWDRGAEGLGRRVPRPRRARHPASDAQSRRRLPDALSEIRAADARLRADDLPGAPPPFRQPHPRDDHRARPRHGRQRRDHRSRSGADPKKSEEDRIRWVISTSAASTASPRRWTR